MTRSFDPALNPHYDFANPANMAEIAVVDGYRLEADVAGYSPGQAVDSPWGSNQVVDVGPDRCLKNITVKPGFMLSLQRHRGRAELWEVMDGTLTVIVNGEQRELTAGQSINLPEGAVHCMVNASDKPVTVRETQIGVCREKDNIRLIDFNDRPLYPLTTDVEFKSAKLYARIQADLAKRFSHASPPHKALLA